MLPAPSRLAVSPVGSRTSAAIAKPASGALTSVVLGAHGCVGHPARVSAAARLDELLATIDVDPRAFEVEFDKRNRPTDFKAIGHADGAVERQRVRMHLQRQGLGVEWRRLVPKLVRRRDERPVGQAQTVELVVVGGAGRRAERHAPSAAGRCPLDEKCSEAVADAVHRPQLGIESIGEPARRGGNRHAREVHQERPGDRVACRRRSRPILLEITGLDRLIRDQKRDHVRGRRLLPGRRCGDAEDEPGRRENRASHLMSMDCASRNSGVDKPRDTCHRHVFAILQIPTTLVLCLYSVKERRMHQTILYREPHVRANADQVVELALHLLPRGGGGVRDPASAWAAALAGRWRRVGSVGVGVGVGVGEGVGPGTGAGTGAASATRRHSPDARQLPLTYRHHRCPLGAVVGKCSGRDGRRTVSGHRGSS